jgi:hypothetical protein
MTTGAFAKISAATPTDGGNIIRDGNYKMLIEKVIVNAGYNGEAFIAEMRVIEAQPNGAVDERGVPVVPNAVGTTASVVCLFKQGDVAYNNAKKLILGVTGGLGYTEAQITPEAMGYLCSDKNPLRGVMVGLETYRGVNKGRNNPANAGKPLTLNKWKPIAQAEADVLAQRTWLDSNAPKAEQAAAPAAATFAQTAPAAALAPAPVQAAPAQPAARPAGGGILGGILGPK